MWFSILGPLEIVSGEDVLTIPGAKQRVILAALLLHAGEVVSVDRLLEIAWGDHQPANPRNALQSQISSLRRLLSEDQHGLIEARAPGYALAVDPDMIDAVRFERLLEEGRERMRAAEPDAARVRLVEALQLWRGSPLAGVDGEGFAEVAIARLNELRLRALEDRIQCDLDTGRHGDIVAEVEALVAEHPLRERLRGQLMLALARAGRQADALAVFHDARRLLDEELGVDPGPALMAVYETVLRQEDTTPVATRTTPSPAATGEGVSELTPTGRIPRPLTNFLGRDVDLQRVIALLDASRLVTLTGPGGVGKTRLAAEAAAVSAGPGLGRDRVWFVELGQLGEPELLWHSVAAGLGLGETPALGSPGPSADVRGRLVDAVRHLDALLVIDNCEHLIEPVAVLVRELLEASRDLTVLCTSREPLGISGETIWSVRSLSLPPEGRQVTLDDVGDWGALALFADRLKRADPNLAVNDGTIPLLVDICRRLDGIPLALELAASRVRTLGLAGTAARLDDRFALLSGGDRTAQPRQRTLRAVIDWSWELLDPDERMLFRRMSVVSGAAPAEFIESVCADGDALPRDRVATVLSSLVDKSMVSFDGHTHPPRYRLLETMRSYAQARLDETTERTDVEERHVRYVSGMVKELAGLLRGSDQLRAMRELDALLDDIRAVLRRLKHVDEANRGGAMAANLGWYWYLRGRRSEGVRAMTEFAAAATPRDAALLTLWTGFLDALPQDEPEHKGLDAALAALREHGSPRDQTLGALLAAVITSAMGDRRRSHDYLGRARELVDQTGDAEDAALIALAVGNDELTVGNLHAAHRSLTTGLARFEGLGDRWGQVMCLLGMLTHAEVTGNLDTAERHAERAILRCRELRLAETEAILHCRRATIAVLAGNHELAQAELDAAAGHAEQLGSEVIARNVDVASAFLAVRTGALDTAEQLLARVLTWSGASPYPALRAYASTRLGTVYELRGEPAQACALHRSAFADMRRLGDPRSMALALEGLAGATAAGGQADDAAVLLGAAETLRASVGLPLPESERTDVQRAADRATDILGEDVFREAVARGRTLPLDELPLV